MINKIFNHIPKATFKIWFELKHQMCIDYYLHNLTKDNTYSNAFSACLNHEGVNFHNNR